MSSITGNQKLLKCVNDAKGDYATKVANQFNGLNATCELTVPKYVKSEIIGAVARELIFLKDFRNYYLT